jgi:hypothetical protein
MATIHSLLSGGNLGVGELKGDDQYSLLSGGNVVDRLNRRGLVEEEWPLITPPPQVAMRVWTG